MLKLFLFEIALSLLRNQINKDFKNYEGEH